MGNTLYNVKAEVSDEVLVRTCYAKRYSQCLGLEITRVGAQTIQMSIKLIDKAGEDIRFHIWINCRFENRSTF